MSLTNTLLLATAAAIATSLVLSSKKKGKLHREPYADVFLAKDIPNDEMISRPSFEAQLAPRFDPFRNGEYNKLNGYLPDLSMQATPINALGNGSFPINSNKVDYSQMGDSGAIAEANVDCAMAKLKKYDAIAQNNSGNNSSEKFAMNFSGSNSMNMNMNGMNMNSNNGLRRASPMNNSALEYLSPKDLLPVPDMASVLTKDPTEPNTFMYDRTLFAPLKRRNINPVDFIRGDLAIPLDNKGWFFSAASPGTDLMVGAMNIIAPDIEQQTMMQDITYARYDHSYPLQANVVSGDLQNRFP
jgi:hypothetical protein